MLGSVELNLLFAADPAPLGRARGRAVRSVERGFQNGLGRATDALAAAEQRGGRGRRGAHRALPRRGGGA
jgi:hypothetical protein